MKETIDLLGKILTNILTALYEPFGFSLLLSFLAMFSIGGVEREDKSIEESHEIVKCKPADNLEIASWNSFVRKLDEYHGHHPVQ